KAVCCDEGDRVSAGALVARLEVPDLASRVTQKRAEVRESEARLRLLEAGPRYEEVAEQRLRVERARRWRDLGQHDLIEQRRALAEELAALDKQAARYRAEREAAEAALQRQQVLRRQGATSAEECRETEKRLQVSQALLEQSQADKRARQAKGT